VNCDMKSAFKKARIRALPETVISTQYQCVTDRRRHRLQACIVRPNTRYNIAAVMLSRVKTAKRVYITHWKLIFLFKYSLLYTVRDVPDINPDILSNDVTCQGVYQVPSDVVRVGVQRSNQMMLGFSDCRTLASVADYVALVIDSHHRSPSGYLDPARHELSSPCSARMNVTLVIIAHKSVELGITNLYASPI